jgi:PAS domain S-box-containing protein
MSTGTDRTGSLPAAKGNWRRPVLRQFQFATGSLLGFFLLGLLLSTALGMGLGMAMLASFSCRVHDIVMRHPWLTWGSLALLSLVVMSLWCLFQRESQRWREHSLQQHEQLCEADEEQAASEQRYRELFDNALLGVYRTTPAGRFLMANPTLAQMLGYDSVEALIAQPISEESFFSDYPRQQFLADMERMGSVQGQEHRLRRRDGTQIYVRESSRAVRDTSGQLLYFEGTLEEITAQKQAELDLLRQKEILDLFLEHVPAGLAMLDHEMRYLLVTRLWCESQHLQREKVLGKTPIEVYGHQKEQFAAPYRRGMQGIATPPTEESVEINGRTHWLRRAVSPWGDPAAGWGGIIVMVEEISAQKMASEELRRRKQILDTFIEHVPAGLAMFDHDLRILAASKRYCEGQGKTLQDLLGRTPQEIYPGKADERWKDPLRLGLQGVATPPSVDFFRMLNGRELWLRREFCPWSDPESGEHGVVVLVDNVSENVERQMQLSRLAEIIDHSGEAVFSIDAQGRFTEWYDSACRLFGYSREQILGQPFSILTPIEQEPEIAELLGRAQKGEQIDEFESICLRSDDSRIDVSLSVIPSQEQDGQRHVISLIVHDITQRKQTEQALRENEARHKSLFDNALLGLYRTAPDGRILLANPALCRMLGCNSFEEVKGRNLEQDGFSSAYSRNIFKREVEVRGAIIGHEARWRRVDGSILYVRESARVIRDAQGNALYYEGTVEDITDRKLIENELLQNREALRISEERYRLVTENTTDAVFDWNLSTRHVYMSPRFYAMLGYENNEFSLTEELWHKMLHPADLQLGNLDSIRTQGTPRAPFNVELRMRHKGGDWVWLQASGRAVMWDTEGRPMRVVGTLNDISTRKQAENERAALQEQLAQSQKMEAVGRLAGGVAHDINNVLQAVVLPAQLLLLGEKRPAARHKLEAMIEVANRGASVAQQLLAFSRRKVTQPRVLDLNRAIGEMKQMLRQLIREDIELRFELRATHSSIEIDAGQLTQILINLVVNARDAITMGGTITVRTMDSHPRRGVNGEHFVLLTVSDNGVGMNHEVSQHIFEPFFTTKGAGKGTGMGLSTTYGIVQQWNGSIDVHSLPDKGSVFTIKFPSLPVIPAESGDTASPLLHGTEQILLFENDDRMRTALSGMLLQYGYAVTAAASPEEAFGMASKSFDLLICDAALPGGEGLHTACELKRLHPAMNVILLHDAATPLTGEEMAGLDATPVEKPVPMQQLLMAMRALLQPHSGTASAQID